MPAPALEYEDFRRLASPNSDGMAFVAIMAPSYAAFQLRRCHYESKVGLVQIAIALRAYQQAEGELPDRLDELVPVYIEALPLDRYEGETLRYSKTKAIVYSIGDDFADAGGFDPPSQSERSEPTLSVAF